MDKRRMSLDSSVFSNVSVCQLREKFEEIVRKETSASFSRQGSERKRTSIRKSSSFRTNVGESEKSRQIVEELYYTEELYVATLIKMTQDYLPSIKIENQKAIEIFEILRNLTDMHILFGKKLEPLRNSPVKIAECFVRSHCLFQIYGEFIRNQATLMKILSNSKHKKKIEKRAEELGDKLGFLAHLLTPYQRLTRYPLLLQQLLKEERDQKSQEKINIAIYYMEVLLCDINSKLNS